MKNELFELPVPTLDGRFTAHYSEKGLTALDFPKVGSARRADRTLRRSIPTGAISLWHRATETALKNILAGRAAKNLPPLDLTGGTEFQQAVWRELRKIPQGKTTSYGEIALAIGKPEPSAPSAARVGQIRFRCWSPATACWRRMEKSAALAEGWIGNADCSRAKGLVCSRRGNGGILFESPPPHAGGCRFPGTAPSFRADLSPLPRNYGNDSLFVPG